MFAVTAPLVVRLGSVRGAVMGTVLRRAVAAAFVAGPLAMAAPVGAAAGGAGGAATVGAVVGAVVGATVGAAVSAADQSSVDMAPVNRDRLERYQLERYRVISPHTRLVLGGRGGDRPLEYDIDRVKVWRTAGVEGSGRGTVNPTVSGTKGGADGGSSRGQVDGSKAHGFVAVGPEVTAGYLEHDGRREWIGEGPRTRTRADANAPTAPPPNVPRCGIDHAGHDCATAHLDASPPTIATTHRERSHEIAAVGAPEALWQTRVVEIAIETDYELFALFGDVQATADHVAMVYAAVSDILERDVGVRLEVTFVRIWDTPDDLFNEENPLQPFRSYWNDNMQDVPRDVAQFLSGRRDLPWGGIAYLNALCGSAAYSIVGYALGVVPDLDAPSVYHFDVPVCAHEVGHNIGSQHTHFYGLDDCDQLDNTPQRGTIMSYCPQTVSGGNAIGDLRFDTVCAENIRGYMADVPCVHIDCHGDGVDDAMQILDDPSLDADGNGILDACDDCDGDGILNAAAIAAGAPDLNGNGIPDHCDPDCNRNGVPDDLDIALGTSLDLWWDGVPDECEEDCDGDGVSDYSQIQANLALDLDRNGKLDACEDCDGDGVIDQVARDGAWDAWVANRDPRSGADGVVRAMHALTGVLVNVSDPGVDFGNDLVITADRRVLVSSEGSDSVVEFAADGSLVGAFVPSGRGGLNMPSGLLLDGDTLLVASRGTGQVLRYALADGAFLSAFVNGGLASPFGLCFGPDDHLYVNDAINRVLRFDGTTGAPLGTLVSALSNGGLSDPRGMLFLPDDRLVVAGRLNDAILSYDGATGAFLGVFNKGGTTNALTFDEPWGLRLGPNGNLFAVRHYPGDPTGTGGGLLHGDIAELHVNASRIYEFHVESGIFLRSYVTGHDTGLWAPTGFDFMPGEAPDCNRNGIADVCDLVSGSSADLNGNGVPDECEGVSPDLNGDGVVDGADLGILLGAWGMCPVAGACAADLNADGVVDGADLGIVLGAWGE